MKLDLQTILVLITFIGAIVFLVNKFFPRRIGSRKNAKKNGCGDDCGCN
ncbi:hypothetical protein ABN763_14075 [Spongiivirga sp. MCCC 1A20706]